MINLHSMNRGFLILLAFQAAIFLPSTNAQLDKTSILDILGKLTGSGDGKGLGSVFKKDKCLAEDARALATIGEITKGMSFYLELNSTESNKLKRTASCLIDAFTPEKANAGQICTSNAPYHVSLQKYMRECDDIVHYRVMRVKAGSDAQVGCVVKLNGRGMWEQQSVNLGISSPTEDFDASKTKELYPCGAKNGVKNLKTIAVQRRMCFATLRMIMNKDTETGKEDKKCDVTMLKLVADKKQRDQIISCAVNSMNKPNENPDDAINKCRCIERTQYKRSVQNCTSESEKPDRCQDLEPASLPQKYSLGYLGSCLKSGGGNTFEKEQRSQLSCLAKVRSGLAAVDAKTISKVRSFLIRCDQSILNHVYNTDDGCVYEVAGSSDAKWDAPQSSQLQRDLSQGSEKNSAELVEVRNIFECQVGNNKNSNGNKRRANQNRQLLNVWRSTCNLAMDMLAGPEEDCSVCKMAVLQRIVPELETAPKSGKNSQTLDDYAKNVFDCTRGLMDSWHTDPKKPFGICLDKELNDIKRELCDK